MYALHPQMLHDVQELQEHANNFLEDMQSPDDFYTGRKLDAFLSLRDRLLNRFRRALALWCGAEFSGFRYELEEWRDGEGLRRCSLLFWMNGGPKGGRKLTLPVPLEQLMLVAQDLGQSEDSEQLQTLRDFVVALEDLEDMVIDHLGGANEHENTNHIPGTIGDEPTNDAPETREDVAAYVFYKDENRWILVFDGKKSTVPHMLGFQLIHQLLEHPNTQLTAKELNGNFAEAADEVGVSGSQARREPLADSQAQSEIRSKIKSLRDKIEEAQEFKNVAVEQKLTVELDKLVEEYDKTFNVHGRARMFPVNESRQFDAARKAIDRALSKLKDKNGTLHEHLDSSIIKSAQRFSYRPLKEVKWMTFK